MGQQPVAVEREPVLVTADSVFEALTAAIPSYQCPWQMNGKRGFPYEAAQHIQDQGSDTLVQSIGYVSDSQLLRVTPNMIEYERIDVVYLVWESVEGGYELREPDFLTSKEHEQSRIVDYDSIPGIALINTHYTFRGSSSVHRARLAVPLMITSPREIVAGQGELSGAYMPDKALLFKTGSWELFPYKW